LRDDACGPRACRFVSCFAAFIRKRLHDPISVFKWGVLPVLLRCASPAATIAAQQLSTVSKTGTIANVLDIYGLFAAVIFSRHFIF
jgi:hypothetical protein